MSTATTTSFQPTMTSVASARHFVTSSLEGAGVPRATVETATLLVSELASNAVQHARSAFSVGMTQHGHSITVAVADESGVQPRVREPSVDGGRGLRIVEALAEEWGVRDRHPGKTVFFRLPC